MCRDKCRGIVSHRASRNALRYVYPSSQNTPNLTTPQLLTSATVYPPPTWTTSTSRSSATHSTKPTLKTSTTSARPSANPPLKSCTASSPSKPTAAPSTSLSTHSALSSAKSVGRSCSPPLGDCSRRVTTPLRVRMIRIRCEERVNGSPSTAHSSIRQREEEEHPPSLARADGEAPKAHKTS